MGPWPLPLRPRPRICMLVTVISSAAPSTHPLPPGLCSFVTIISWIPGHGASYLGASSPIPGARPLVQRLALGLLPAAAAAVSKQGPAGQLAEGCML